MDAKLDWVDEAVDMMDREENGVPIVGAFASALH